MRLKLIFSIVFAVVAIFTTSLSFSSIKAHASQADATITITSPWVRYNPMQGRASAAYLTLENTSNVEQAVVGFLAPSGIHAMIHNTVKENDVMRMLSIESVTIEPGQTVKFAPKGLHIMLMNMPQGLKVGSTVELTLKLSSGDEVEVPFKVCPITSTHAC